MRERPLFKPPYLVPNEPPPAGPAMTAAITQSVPAGDGSLHGAGRRVEACKCAKRGCKWSGPEDDLVRKRDWAHKPYPVYHLSCPRCGQYKTGFIYDTPTTKGQP